MESLAYPADTSWVIPMALLVGAVGIVIYSIVRTLLWRVRRAEKLAREESRRRAGRARYERHEVSKARVRFAPSDDHTTTGDQS